VDAANGQSLKRVDDLFARARALATDVKGEASERSAAVRLLGRDPKHQADDVKLLTGLLNPQTPDVIQTAAVSALAKSRAKETPQLLLEGWKGYSPSIRAAALDALLARPEGVTALLDAIDAKRVLPADVDAPRRQKLLKANGPAAQRERAAKLLADVVHPDRQKVIDAFAPALTLPGDGKHGAEIFTKTCATCHQLNNAGHPVGPDLASVGDKSPEGLLISILDPNRAVDPKFVGYVAETKDGETLTGVLSAEAGNSVTVLQADGNARQVIRSDLKSLRSTGQSLMPEGLESGLKPQDLADLIAFVRSAGPQPARRAVEGNRPELVLPDGKGTLRLTAGNSEIYGTTLVLERQYGNLGMWTSDNDHATWSVQPARAGRYAVWIDYACEDKAAGNAFVLQAGTARLTGRVAGTKNWDTYKRIHIGDITLTAGRQRVTLRPEGKIAGALLDLKTIELVPQPND
jgi:putative heme-binding domain-containing protein